MSHVAWQEKNSNWIFVLGFRVDFRVRMYSRFFFEMLTINPAANESASLSVNLLVEFQPNALSKRIRVGVELVFCLFILRRHCIKHTGSKWQDIESYMKSFLFATNMLLISKIK